MRLRRFPLVSATAPVRLAFVGLVASALVACTVGTPYVRPSAPTPPTYKETTGWAPAEPADALDRGLWWTLFGDDELDRLEAKVEVSNQNVAAAVANYAQDMAGVISNKFLATNLVAANVCFTRAAA